MKNVITGCAVAGLMAAGSLTWAGVAAAAPAGGSNAQDVINSLQSQGYNVAINYDNGQPAVALTQCTTTAVHGLWNSVPDGQAVPTSYPFTTAYVDVFCSDGE